MNPVLSLRVRGDSSTLHPHHQLSSTFLLAILDTGPHTQNHHTLEGITYSSRTHKTRKQWFMHVARTLACDVWLCVMRLRNA